MLATADILEIQNLLGRYAQCWDGYDLDGFAGLFAADGVVDFGVAVLRSHAEIRAFHDKTLGGFRRIGMQRRHLLGSIVISPDDAARATVDLYGQVFSTDPATTGTTVMPPVRYHGVVAKQADGSWKIAEWAAHPDRPFNNPT